MRALIAIPELDVGGPDAVTHRLLRAADRSRAEFAVAVTRRDGRYLRDLPADVDVHFVGRPDDRYPVRALGDLVRRLRPDVVLATQRMTFTCLAARRWFPPEVRLVLRQSTLPSALLAELAAHRPWRARLALAVYGQAFPRADLVICQSAAMADDLAQLGVPRARLAVIPNPIDVQEATALGQQPAELILRGRPAALAVGRLAPSKNFGLLLTALRQAAEHEPDLHLTIAGRGPLRGPLEQQRQALGLEAKVTFAGHVDNPFALMKRAHFLVSASTYEGFANTTLEALALGTPAVVTTGPAAGDEIVQPGLNGWLCRPGDLDDLVESLLAACTQHRALSSTAIVSDVERRFGSVQVADRYVSALEAVRDVGSSTATPALRLRPRSRR